MDDRRGQTVGCPRFLRVPVPVVVVDKPCGYTYPNGPIVWGYEWSNALGSTVNDAGKTAGTGTRHLDCKGSRLLSTDHHRRYLPQISGLSY